VKIEKLKLLCNRKNNTFIYCSEFKMFEKQLYQSIYIDFILELVTHVEFQLRTFFLKLDLYFIDYRNDRFRLSF